MCEYYNDLLLRAFAPFAGFTDRQWWRWRQWPYEKRAGDDNHSDHHAGYVPRTPRARFIFEASAPPWRSLSFGGAAFLPIM